MYGPPSMIAQPSAEVVVEKDSGPAGVADGAVPAGSGAGDVRRLFELYSGLSEKLLPVASGCLDPDVSEAVRVYVHLSKGEGESVALSLDRVVPLSVGPGPRACLSKAMGSLILAQRDEVTASADGVRAYFVVGPE